MRGHNPLIDLRMRRRNPGMVSISVQSERSWIADQWHQWEGCDPSLQIEPADPVSRLDLRCLVGLRVDLMGHESVAARVRAVHQACIDANAERVMTAIWREKGEEVEIVELIDSKQVLSWPQH